MFEPNPKAPAPELSVAGGNVLKDDEANEPTEESCGAALWPDDDDDDADDVLVDLDELLLFGWVVRDWFESAPKPGKEILGGLFTFMGL